VRRHIDEHRGRFGVEPICRTLGVSASAYYQRAKGERSERAVEDERLLERIKELQRMNYFASGYRRMWKALLRAGERVPRCRVQRLMGAHGIQGAKRRGKPGAPPARTRAPSADRTWSSATSASTHRTGCGSPICPISGAGKGWCSSPS
jgi:putative transposase